MTTGLRVLALCAVALLMLVACSPADPDLDPVADPADEPVDDPADDAVEAAVQELVVGASEDSYETEGPRANVAMSPQNTNVYETLVRMDADYQVQPVLATDWELLEPNTWRFTLREGVTFHDGTPFDADAVKFTFDRIAEAGGGTLRLGEDSTEIIDEFTVEVTPMVENRRLMEQLVHPQNSVIPPGSDPGVEQIGTGPFRMVSYEPQERLVVERNDDYWGDLPTLDRIEFRFIPDDNARRLALEAGEIDVMLSVPPAMADVVEDRGFVLSTPAPGVMSVMYAHIAGEQGYTTLQEENVRRAIAHAIDRDTLIEGVFEDRAEPEQTMIPARLLGEHAAKIEGFDHDPDRAAQLLDEAGWELGDDGIRERDGEPLSLELVSGFPSAEEHGATPEFLQAQLREVGIDVTIVETPDSASYTERRDSLEGDLWLERGNQNDANPAFLPALLFWTEGIFGPGSYQAMFAPGGEFDDIIVEALAARDSETANERTAEAMRILIDEEVVVIPLAGLTRMAAHTDRVQGFEAQPSHLQVLYTDVWLSG